MIPYANNFLEAITITAPTPAANHLFQVHPKNERRLLPEEQAQVFHCSTVQLLFLSMRVQPGLLTLVSFFTKQLRSQDEENMGSLKRGI